MTKPSDEVREVARTIVAYIVKGIRTTSEFGPTGNWSAADSRLATKIQAVIDKEAQK